MTTCLNAIAVIPFIASIGDGCGVVRTGTKRSSHRTAIFAKRQLIDELSRTRLIKGATG